MDEDAPNFPQLEGPFGYSYEPHGFLADEHLNIDLSSGWLFDWMHCMLIAGVFVVEVRLCIQKVQEHYAQYSQTTWRDYIGNFAAPQAFSIEGEKVFEKVPADGSAFEWLSVCTTIRKFCLDFLLDACPIVARAIMCVVLCWDVLLALSAMESSRTTPDQLACLIREYLELHLREYGLSAFLAKHHYLLHLPQDLKFWGMLLSTFVHERKHRLIKRFANQRCNLKSFTKNMLGDIVLDQLYHMDRAFAEISFCDAVPAEPALESIVRGSVDNSTMYEVATLVTVFVHCRKNSRGDIVGYIGADNVLRIGKLMAHARCGADMLAIVATWEKVSCRKSGAVRYKVLENNGVVVPTQWLKEGFVYSIPCTVGGICEVLVPQGLQHLL